MADKVIVSDPDDGERIGFETKSITGVIEDVFSARSVVLDMLRRREFNPLEPESISNAMRELGKVDDGKYSNLVNLYPLMTRHMVATGDVDRKLLDKYFTWVGANVWQSQEEFLKVQAKFLYFQALHVGRTEEEAGEILANAEEELLREDRELREVAEKAQREYAAQEAALREHLAATLKNLAQFSQQEGVQIAPPESAAQASAPDIGPQ